MKTKAIYLTMVIALISLTTVFGQTKTKKFKVYGNCGMCESRIEKAAKSVDGVIAVDWNKENKMMEVSFDASKTDVHKVHMVIAKAGHDTEMHKAKDETYNSLPGCCKYDRPDSKKKKTIVVTNNIQNRASPFKTVMEKLELATSETSKLGSKR